MAFRKSREPEHREVVHKLVDSLLDKEKGVKRGRPRPRWFPRLLTTPRFLDHQGRVKGEEREFVIGEPYGMDSSLVRELIKFCGEHGLDFDIGGDSTYYPGATVVVRLFKKNI